MACDIGCPIRGWLWGIALVVIVALAALGANRGTSERAGTLAASPVQVAEAEEAKEAPDFETLTLDGKVFRLRDARPTVVVFFAAWCPPCNAEAPHIQKIHEKYSGKGLHVIGLGLASSRQELEAFRDKHHLSYPIGLDDRNEKTAERYGVSGVPTTFVIGHSGAIAAQFVGFDGRRGPRRLEEAVEKVLAEHEASNA